MREVLTIGLAEAAQRLRLPYQNCHRLLLTGTLNGEKRDGRWYVHTADVERLVGKGETMPRVTKKELEEENAHLRDTLEEVSDKIGQALEQYEDEEEDADESDDD